MLKIRAFTFAVLSSFSISSCSQQAEIDAETKACAQNLYSKFDPKNLNQCTAVCIACSNGVTTTCATSCTLKGAR